MKLTYTTKIEIEYANEDELQICLRNLPCMQSQIGQSSAQSGIKQIASTQMRQLTSLDEPQKEAIIKALATCETKTAAAEFLGITRATLNAKIKAYEI